MHAKAALVVPSHFFSCFAFVPYCSTECICCANTIFAIQDADFVLCPDCRVVSPMDGKEFDGVSDGGVGLGFKMEDLAKWQEDIEESIKFSQ